MRFNCIENTASILVAEKTRRTRMGRPAPFAINAVTASSRRTSALANFRQGQRP